MSFFFFFNFFLAMLRSLQDLSSLTRNQTHAPLQWKHRVLTTGLPGKSLQCLFCVAAYHLLTATKTASHVTSALCGLTWCGSFSQTRRLAMGPIVQADLDYLLLSFLPSSSSSDQRAGPAGHAFPVAVAQRADLTNPVCTSLG